MVLVSAAARKQIDALARYYDELDREQATARMTVAMASAVKQIEDQVGPFWQAPRPYPGATRRQWKWLKSHRYWIAFEPISEGYAITAIFYDAANIPGRL